MGYSPSSPILLLKAVSYSKLLKAGCTQLGFELSSVMESPQPFWETSSSTVFDQSPKGFCI